MKVACLCPTFGRPRLLANALAQFQAQVYPQDLKRLFILEDAGQIGMTKRTPFGEYLGFSILPKSDSCPSWEERLASGPDLMTCEFELWSFFHKFPTLTAKYAFLVERAKAWGADAFVVWDDDDIYLPNHIQNHVNVLALWPWSHPHTVYSLYTGKVEEEIATGRFHAALAFSRAAGEKIGYWGDVANGRCDYDQGILGRLRNLTPPGQSVHKPTFVMRWGSTHADHCSGRCRSGDDLTWYTKTPISQPGHVDSFGPLMDEETKRIYLELSNHG